MLEQLLMFTAMVAFALLPFVISYLALNWVSSYTRPGRHRIKNGEISNVVEYYRAENARVRV